MTDKELKPKYKVNQVLRNQDGETRTIVEVGDDYYKFDDCSILHFKAQDNWEPVEGADWLKELQDKLDSLSKEDFNKVWAKYKQEREEEPVSEDLKEAALQYAKDYLFTPAAERDLRDHFIAGAQWQKEQDQKWLRDNYRKATNDGYEEGFEAGRDDVYDELEEGKDLSAEIDFLSKRYPEVSFAKLTRIAKHVAEWQKKQTIKEYDDFITKGLVAAKGIAVGMAYEQGKIETINKAVEWLQRNIDSSMWLMNLRKYLED